jgi:hypothetical protein
MIQRVAMVFGVVFLLVGILGLVTPGGTGMGVDPPAAMILGLFPVNLVHNVVHIAFGAWGLVAARSFAGARNYGRIGGAIYALLAILGFVMPNGFGLVPLGGHDIWLHAVLAVGLLAAGFMAKEEVKAA